jgi:hypothetical protein
MGRWITGLFTAHGDAEMNLDDGCSVCDHPFGHMQHACISSIVAPTPLTVGLPIRLPESVVA